MRIDAYNQIATLYNAPKQSKINNSAQTTSARDQVQISRAGRDYHIAKKAVAAASDIREDKVTELKAGIKSGNYNVDTGDFASILLSNYYSAEQ
ncbi:MAG: flagellar biosynthesis anti-sigma factor FlgM [Eubacterium sp.]|nr:flagellar biosynthesis anti-sigma factor FlgM [Eubacterium sp.]